MTMLQLDAEEVHRRLPILAAPATVVVESSTSALREAGDIVLAVRD